MEETLVTGASGFLGTNLTSRLESFTAIPHQDITTDSFVLPHFNNFYFLSTYGNLANHTDDKAIRQANVGDLLNILGHIDPNKPFHSFIFTSTSSVQLRRQTTYSRCKKAAEQILLAYMEKYNLPIAIVRPFSITGVGEQSQHLIPTLIRSCLSGEQMDFVSSPVHDYIDVDDVVSGMLSLSKHRAKGVFELGTGQPYTNEQVKEVVEEVTGKTAMVNRVYEMRDYDNSEWVSSNFRSRTFGWMPQKSLRQSVEEMVKAYES